MSRKIAWSIAGAALVLLVTTARTGRAAAGTPPARQIAIIIDDLPAGAAQTMSAAAIVQMTTQLLAALKQQNVPAVGFVNERKLYYQGGEVDERIRALSLWLDAGFELGNHTYGHTSLNGAGLKEFEDAVRVCDTHFADAAPHETSVFPASVPADEYVGEEGTNWLDHWAVTRGYPLQGVPEFPAEMAARAKALQRTMAPQ